MTSNQNLSKDLRSLGILLGKDWSKNIENPNLLLNLITSHSKSDKWEYELSESKPLIFRNIDIGRNLLPSNLGNNIKNIKLKLNIKLAGSKTTNSYIDPIQELALVISVVSYNFSGEESEIDCLQSWHLDRAEEDKEKKEEFTHPLYHLNFGGNVMRKSGKDFGALMLLASPRICHPPLDLVLAVDFILKNFYTKENHKKITQQKSYRDILKNATSRFWKPFAYSYASFWDDDNNIENDPSRNPANIFPSLDCL